MADIIKDDELPIVDDNPITEIRKKGEGSLIIEETHQKPVTKSTIYIIEDLQNEINKIDNVIAIWEAKKKPLQDLVDEYEGMI